jgi:BED zinc finger
MSESRIEGSRKRAKYQNRSEWWDHYDEVTVGKYRMAKCKYCGKQYEKNGTGNMKNHIITKHQANVAVKPPNEMETVGVIKPMLKVRIPSCNIIPF